MEFANLDLRTLKSRLGDYFAMHYKDFNEDMSSYLENIFMYARFRNSEINSDDISFLHLN